MPPPGFPPVPPPGSMPPAMPPSMSMPPNAGAPGPQAGGGAPPPGPPPFPPGNMHPGKTKLYGQIEKSSQMSQIYTFSLGQFVIRKGRAFVPITITVFKLPLKSLGFLNKKCKLHEYNNLDLFVFHRYASDAHAPSRSSWHGTSSSCSTGINSSTGTATTWHAPAPAHGHATQSTVWTSHG